LERATRQGGVVMYRVFDNVEKRWVREGIYLSPNNDLSTSKKVLFGSEKLSLVSSQRYIFHRDIGLCDKNEVLIFEGDIGKIKSLDSIGLITYVPEHASYYLLDYKNSKYYTLGEANCKEIEIIGNVLENSNLIGLN
jgi:hypothetical protein